uniref:Uncharacterized protein n=1 Tax=Ditylenchus dipsaci TaxID=166011 RepID=A0A915DRB4_9BILA
MFFSFSYFAIQAKKLITSEIMPRLSQKEEVKAERREAKRLRLAKSRAIQVEQAKSKVWLCVGYVLQGEAQAFNGRPERAVTLSDGIYFYSKCFIAPEVEQIFADDHIGLQGLNLDPCIFPRRRIRYTIGVLTEHSGNTAAYQAQLVRRDEEIVRRNNFNHKPLMAR